MIGKICLTMFCALSVCMSVVYGGAWPYEGPKRDVVTLVVTSNLLYPRMMAELIQAESRQPILLLPARSMDKIYFCPPKEKSPALEVSEANLTRFISFVNPKRIVVIGGPDIVPQRYLNRIDPSMPIAVVSGRNYQRIAVMLSDMLALSNLDRNFEKLDREIRSGKLYRPNRQSEEKSGASSQVPNPDGNAAAPAEPSVAPAGAANGEALPSLE
ncbi:MAG: hypothetical protein PHS41_01455 [Victivallaceae bacterium]|nr:hypothetical protein [Victivallaceae bacterium]